MLPIHKGMVSCKKSMLLTLLCSIIKQTMELAKSPNSFRQTDILIYIILISSLTSSSFSIIPNLSSFVHCSFVSVTESVCDISVFHPPCALAFPLVFTCFPKRDTHIEIFHHV